MMVVNSSSSAYKLRHGNEAGIEKILTMTIGPRWGMGRKTEWWTDVSDTGARTLPNCL